MNVAIEIEDALEEVELPSKTYHMNWETGRIAGICNGKMALEQAIHKALLTSRGSFPILYSDSYGSDIESAVLGDSPTDDYLITVVPQLVKNCLYEDDRIIDVYDFHCSFEGENLYISFCVDSDFGKMTIQEVL